MEGQHPRAAALKRGGSVTIALAAAASAAFLMHGGSGAPSPAWASTEAAASEPRGRLALSRTASRATAGKGSAPLVAVLGANGRTGALVVEALLKAGARTRALTRSGQWTPPKGSSTSSSAAGLEVQRADVTDASTLAAGLAGAAAVVFAAAYVRNKSMPKDVDYAGLVSTARTVRDMNIGRLVVVSSAAVTRPYAPVGILLNTIGSGVLLEKLKGESEMRGILKGSGSTYTVVRPGGLLMDEPVGFEPLEFNQGDTLVGNVPRADVAAVSAVAALDPANRGANKTFEMYKAKTRNGLLPWYGDTKYVVSGRSDCGEMLAQLRNDDDVKDVPGFLPF